MALQAKQPLHALEQRSNAIREPHTDHRPTPLPKRPDPTPISYSNRFSRDGNDDDSLPTSSNDSTATLRVAVDETQTKAGPSRPPARPSTRSSRHHLEHNPFEQSFSKPSDSPDGNVDDVEVDTPTKRRGAKGNNAKDGEKAGRASSVASTSTATAAAGAAPSKEGATTSDKAAGRGAGTSTPTGGKDAQTPSSKRVLPPVSSMTSPSANESGSNHYPWSNSFSSSLRSGPLSPAMLAGPQSSFDPSAFRTGFTPDLSTFKTGLTPLGATGASFPPPSPNTAAFLAMVTNSSGPGLSGATITPNTLSALSGNPMDNVANQNAAVTSQPGSNKQDDQQQQQQQQQSQQQQQQPSQARGTNDGQAQQPQGQQRQDAAANVKAENPAQTTQAASGLFLLSQAHQELAKREDAAAAAQAAAHALHGVQRPSDSQQQALYNSSQQPQHLGPNAAQHGGKGAAAGRGAGKRKKSEPKGAAGATGGAKKAKSAKSEQGGSVASMSGDDLDDDDDDDEARMSKGAGGIEDEEKRKNFLERNRQAALKCRQRKKAWLASLQAKVEYLQTDNEHLQGTVSALRNEIMFLKSQLMQTQRQLGPNVNGGNPNALLNGNNLNVNQAAAGAVAPGLGRNSMSGPVPISNGAPLGPGNVSAGMVANGLPMTSMSGVSGAPPSTMNLANVGAGQYQAHAVPRPTHIPGQYTHTGQPNPQQQLQSTNHARQTSGSHQAPAPTHDRRGEAQVA
ncbi:hypothetical protein FA10DRAFT_259627 [Acaromyces ingoldii]|uniref:BZIP domain-containing protein n=1 Tax=Acaromyces ingoldii TaxID=215250 RepID=A0A316YUU7_9BASI|nr:hypothetical protein FA10DRAFT_259627 [Acaromyces ingoldii]PWN92448.1 hypothetical protein FA10DRAFT_259627 [Acaromyces ingoldii]